MNLLETERLSLRRLSVDADAEFILELLNEPSFIKNIGDRGVRSVEDARRYIVNGPVASYERYGFGLYRVGLKASDEPMGMCGLLKRDSIEDVEVGFAFLPRFWSKGYALESAAAVKAHGRDVLGLKRLAAIVNPDNQGSIRVLERIGLKYERMVRLPGEAQDIRFYAVEL
ncbi:GNAT family N-acetyltransferase [Vitiosangium sp. GDMCC 1.1324]|uniref:GNAT family N-acetyltransferase n=1 Tax=Vitiosangium sp. (strain GDMCC 1.1324) TaxID=2138576 RepID=UPI000D36D2FF|nr:GNAT family N-acetyltransferase [Vitiosangium sp. GDMCC 1.1324]PTL83444.1 GNAT family N-acetyltransferase [Vitiosangium sp. GDMCC 1.1324]